MAKTWNQLLAGWLNRADVMRLNVTEADSPYLKVGVLTNKAGQVAYVSNQPDTEGEVVFGDLPLPSDVVPVFTATVLTYGTASSGTKLLNVERSFESKDEFFVAGDIGAGDMFESLVVWERSRKADAPESYDGYAYNESLRPFEGVEVVAVNAAIDKVISRINANKPSVDTRTETWGVSKATTAYGKYKEQQRRDAAERKARKSA